MHLTELPSGLVIVDHNERRSEELIARDKPDVEFHGYWVDLYDTAMDRAGRVYQDLDWHEASLWWWFDGNMGCDCNRMLELYRRDETMTEAVQCGEGRILLHRIVKSDGIVEDDWTQLNDFDTSSIDRDKVNAAVRRDIMLHHEDGEV